MKDGCPVLFSCYPCYQVTLVPVNWDDIVLMCKVASLGNLMTLQAVSEETVPPFLLHQLQILLHLRDAAPTNTSATGSLAGHTA